MRFDQDLQRRLRTLSQELEHSASHIPAGRRPPKLRYSVAGLGMAACIAAALVLFAQLLPKDEPAGRIGTASSPSESSSDIPTTNGPAISSPQPDWTPGPGSSVPPTAPASPTAPPKPSRAPQAVVACPDPGTPKPPPDGVVVSVTPARQEGAIEHTAQFRNDRSTPVQNEFGNPKVDYIVFDDAGKVVWVWSAGMTFTMELSNQTYAPGQTEHDSQMWDLRGCPDEQGETRPLPAGRYAARAKWSGSMGGWSEPVAFEIDQA